MADSQWSLIESSIELDANGWLFLTEIRARELLDRVPVETVPSHNLDVGGRIIPAFDLFRTNNHEASSLGFIRVWFLGSDGRLYQVGTQQFLPTTWSIEAQPASHVPRQLLDDALRQFEHYWVHGYRSPLRFGYRLAGSGRAYDSNFVRAQELAEAERYKALQPMTDQDLLEWFRIEIRASFHPPISLNNRRLTSTSAESLARVFKAVPIPFSTGLRVRLNAGYRKNRPMDGWLVRQRREPFRDNPTSPGYALSVDGKLYQGVASNKGSETLADARRLPPTTMIEPDAIYDAWKGLRRFQPGVDDIR